MNKVNDLNTAKASMLFENAMKKIQEKQRKEIDELFAHLQSTGMHGQGPGYQQWTNLMAKHVDETSEAYVDSLLSSLDSSHRIGRETEQFLIERSVSHLERQVNSRNAGFRRKLISEGLEHDSGLIQTQLALLPNKSLATRQYITNKIRLKIIEMNESFRSSLTQTLSPNLAWYLGKSREMNLAPRCPFASVHKCPRYFQSLSLLGNAGNTKIPKELDEKLLRKWKKSALWPETKEYATGVVHVDNAAKHYNNFCPEVLFDRFKLFASDLNSYSDQIDIDNAHQKLGRQNAQTEDWRWHWADVQPSHYSGCSLYSLLTLEYRKDETIEDVIELKPNFFGFGLNLNALWRKLNPFRQGAKLEQ